MGLLGVSVGWGRAGIEDEDLKDEKRYSANFSANRTTEMWKISVTGRGSYTERHGTVQRRHTLRGHPGGRVHRRPGLLLPGGAVVVGRRGGTATSTRNNQDLSGDVGTGVEYSFFPYRDWTRRRMTLQALVYARYFDYEEETQFNKMTETVMEGSLKWGAGLPAALGYGQSQRVGRGLPSRSQDLLPPLLRWAAEHPDRPGPGVEYRRGHLQNQGPDLHPPGRPLG